MFKRAGTAVSKVRTAAGKAAAVKQNLQGKAYKVRKHYRRVEPVWRHRQKIGKAVYAIMYLVTFWKRKQ